MSTENPQNPKNPYLRIVRENEDIKDDPDAGIEKTETKNPNIPFLGNLEFCENIKEVIEIDESSRSKILSNLYEALKEYEEIIKEDKNITEVTKLILASRIYTQIFRFESDLKKKEEIEKTIYQINSILKSRISS